MKRLILVRHAKSSWHDPRMADFDRPLNDRGRKAAPRMGRHLAAQDVRPDHVITSPAVRALTTARIIAEAMGWPAKKIRQERAIYEAAAKTLMRLIHQFDDAHEQVMMFGHNPGMTELANQLGDRWIENIPTCGVVTLDLKIDRWSNAQAGSGRCLRFDTPKALPDA